MKCRFCGKKIKKNSNICKGCGKEVTEGLRTDEMIDAMPELHDDFDKISKLQAKDKKKKEKKQKREENKLKRAKIAIAVILVVTILAGVVVGALIYTGVLGKEEVVTPSTSAIEGELRKTFTGINFTGTPITDEVSAKAAITSGQQTMEFADVDNEYEFDKKIEFSGGTIYRFRQVYQGIPVYGGEAVISARDDGTPISYNCAYVTTQGLTAAHTIDKATAENAIVDYVSKLPDEYVIVSGVNVTPVQKTVTNTNGKTYLAYVANVSGYNRLDEYNAYDVFVDAVGGGGIGVIATSSFENEVTEETQNTEESYIYEIATVNDKFKWNDEKSTIAEDKIQISDITSGNTSPYVASVKDAVDRAYNFFNTQFGWKGLDGKGTGFKVYINSNQYVSDKIPTGNALYTNGKLMFFREDLTQGEIDYNTVVHEYAHGVMQNISGVKGTKALNENAAIVEGMADIFAELAEMKQNGTADWKHGERDMAVPSNGYYMTTSGAVNITNLQSCYAYSTVVSHMGQFTADYIKDINTLSEYWLRVACTMTQHTDFTELYQILNCVALSMLEEGKIDGLTQTAIATGVEMMGLSEQGLNESFEQ
ncbi:MAG: M36 family metallopeptidase [Clostridia bacterium]|nr:M36 family metallopeptidase [Clostridia bacterium]